MKYLMLFWIATGLLWAGDSDSSQQDLSVDQILAKTLTAPRPATYSAVYTIIHTDQKDNSKERKALFFFGLDPEDQKRQSQILYFLEPKELLGTASLVENYMDKGKAYEAKSWIYTPLFRRVKANSVSNWRNRQFGSAMTVFDGIHHDLDWFESKLLGKEKVGAWQTYKIEMRVADDKVAERSGYQRLVRWIETTHFTVVKAEAYNVRDELVRSFEFDLQLMEPYMLPTTTRTTLHRADGKTEVTEVIIENIKLDVDLPYQSFFSSRTLRNGISGALQQETLAESAASSTSAKGAEEL